MQPTLASSFDKLRDMTIRLSTGEKFAREFEHLVAARAGLFDSIYRFHINDYPPIPDPELTTLKELFVIGATNIIAWAELVISEVLEFMSTRERRQEIWPMAIFLIAFLSYVKGCQEEPQIYIEPKTNFNVESISTTNAEE